MYHSILLAAREEGKYRAIGGHKARAGMYDRVTGRTRCAICERPLSWNEERHVAVRRRRSRNA